MFALLDSLVTFVLRDDNNHEKMIWEMKILWFFICSIQVICTISFAKGIYDDELKFTGEWFSY